MTATTALAYLQLQPNLRTGEQMTFHLIGECGRFGLWPFWTYTIILDSRRLSPIEFTPPAETVASSRVWWCELAIIEPVTCRSIYCMNCRMNRFAFLSPKQYFLNVTESDLDDACFFSTGPMLHRPIVSYYPLISN